MTNNEQENSLNIERLPGDKKLSIAIMASYVVLTLQYFVLVYFNMIGTTDGFRIQQLSKIVVGFIFIYAFPTVIKRSKMRILKVYFIAVFIILANILLFPDNKDQLSSIILPLLFMNIPAFIYVLSIYDLLVLKDIMKKASFIVFGLGTTIGVLAITGTVSVGSYSMSLSYYMLLPMVMFSDKLMERFSLKYLFLLLISILVVLALGARGAIVGLIVFIILKFIRPNQRLSRKKVFEYTTIVAVFFVVLISLENIIQSLYYLLLRFGINSRSLMLFLKDDINLSGRAQLYKASLNEISQNPLFGIGLAGDRRVLNGFYVHNIFLELFLNFGVIIGILLVIVLVFMVTKILVLKNAKLYNLGTIWIALGFVHLMLTGSYLIDMKFWIFLGVVINIIKQEQKIVSRRLNDA